MSRYLVKGQFKALKLKDSLNILYGLPHRTSL